MKLPFLNGVRLFFLTFARGPPGIAGEVSHPALNLDEPSAAVSCPSTESSHESLQVGVRAQRSPKSRPDALQAPP